MSLRDWPLRARIRRLAVVPVLVVATLLGGYFLVERFNAFSSELDLRGEMMARQLAPAAEYGVIVGNRAVLQALMAPLLAENDVVFVVVRDASGGVLAEQYKEGARALVGNAKRVRIYRASVAREHVLNDALSELVTLRETTPASLGEVEVGMVTDLIAARQREVLLRALLIAAFVLIVTLVVASRTADAMVRIEEARASAENSSRAKSEFLAMMSHELRTPMNGVLGMLELLGDTALDGDQRHCLETARRSSEHLLVVIDDILDFSRIEGGRLPLEQIEFDLADLLHAVVDGFAHQAQTRGITLTLEVEEGLSGIFVTSDPTRLRQVLVNLVGNAIKFTERGGVSLHAGGQLGTDGRLTLVLTVEDTGIGIAADRIEQMFEPFSQADNSTSRRYGGTGLGLPIARRLVAMLGGRVEVQSRVGEGTRFQLHFVLPARRTGAVARTERLQVTTPGASLAGRRLLVVEDNHVSQMVAEGMLGSLGASVDVVGDGHAALARLATDRYDLVLMDVQMPGIDGLETTRRLRARSLAEGGRTPVVAVTANALSGERERCLAAGMDAYISKPFTRDRLRDVLVSLLGIQPG
ncbi:MAG: ATP-binding protein [Gammaproteobacteria bacterium]